MRRRTTAAVRRRPRREALLSSSASSRPLRSPSSWVFRASPCLSPGIENYGYMMENMAVLPDITFLCLIVMANGHAFEASTFHVLRLCTGLRRLSLQLVATKSEAQTVCTSDCICLQQVEWKTEELLLNHLEEVEISGWGGTEHVVAFVKRLFDWGTKIKEMTVNLRHSISEVKAKVQGAVPNISESL